MIDKEDLRTVVGETAHDRDGDRIGKIGAVYYDDDTDQPKWITVNTGLFGLKESFVPLRGADVTGDGVQVTYDKATVKDAPKVDADGHLPVEEEQRLYRHYGLDHRNGRYDHHRDGHDQAMTRSEEQLRVGTETREVGRARLRKHVVTEQQRVSVPVSHEEVTIEREPITDANRDAAFSGPDISEGEHEVVLSEQRPVVDREAVPVERVRLRTETHTDHETVGGEVRKERIEFDDDTSNRRR